MCSNSGSEDVSSCLIGSVFIISVSYMDVKAVKTSKLKSDKEVFSPVDEQKCCSTITASVECAHFLEGILWWYLGQWKAGLISVCLRNPF